MSKEIKLYKVSEYNKEVTKQVNGEEWTWCPAFEVVSEEVLLGTLNDEENEVTLADGKKLGYVEVEDVLHGELIYESVDVLAPDDSGTDYYIEECDSRTTVEIQCGNLTNEEIVGTVESLLKTVIE